MSKKRSKKLFLLILINSFIKYTKQNENSNRQFRNGFPNSQGRYFK